MAHDTDTIAAIATARGQAALAIVRISGPNALAAVERCFRGKPLISAPSHTVQVGFITQMDGTEIDQVVVTVFRAPHSATGEDVVEITCHGGDFAPTLVLHRLLEEGILLAEPGAFTRRAFLNGKLDLAQAEAVADLIHASSFVAHQVSLRHLQGRYSKWLQDLRTELLSLCALIELELDFSEEDVSFADPEKLEALLLKTEKLLTDLLKSCATGALIRDGVRVAIGGYPNAGKSTLLNALLGLDRAIVSPIPGTTRDSIEAEAEFDGIRFIFIDTAGLRHTTDVIESEGVNRARRAIENADILLYVYDLTLGIQPDEIVFLRALRSEHPALISILIGNKDDLPHPAVSHPSHDFKTIITSSFNAVDNPELLTPVISELTDFVRSRLSGLDHSPVVTNQRHQQHIRRALSAIQSAHGAFSSGASGDMLSIDLRTALHELGAITGEITNEDILGEIFSRFCIGK